MAGRLVSVGQEVECAAFLVDVAVVVVVAAAVDRLDGYTRLDCESQPELNR